MIKYTIERFKIKTGIFKHEYIYRVYKNITSKNAIGSYKKYEGSYKECKKYLKALTNI